MEESSPRILNPWFSMWTKPCETIQQIIDTNPDRLVLVLAAIAGFSRVLNRASLKNGGDEFAWPTIFFIAAIAGPIFGIIFIYLYSAAIYLTGGWIGGQASGQHLRAAIAWSSVPLIWELLLWPPQLLLFGQELFTTEKPIIAASQPLQALYVGSQVLRDIIGAWAVILFLKSLRQVQEFSGWKVLGNLLLAGLILFVPIVLFLLVVMEIFRI